MKENDHLAVVAMEECAEIQQAIAKSIRFGYEDYHPDTPNITNGQQVLIEFYQLSAMIEGLQERELLQKLSLDEVNKIKTDKIAKVTKYLSYSKNKGIVER